MTTKKPHITITPAHAPFQTRLEIDLSHLEFKDRRALSNALQLEAMGISNLHHYEIGAGRMEYQNFICMDATPLMRDQLQAVLDRFARRHELTADVAEPTFSIWTRLHAWLFPKHDAPKALKSLGSVRLEGAKYRFECRLNCTSADVDLVRSVTAIIKDSPVLCPRVSVKLRGRTLRFACVDKEPLNNAWLVVQKLTFDKSGKAPAINPIALRMRTLF